MQLSLCKHAAMLSEASSKCCALLPVRQNTKLHPFEMVASHLLERRSYGEGATVPAAAPCTKLSQLYGTFRLVSYIPIVIGFGLSIEV